MPSAANGWAGQPPPTWQQGYGPQGNAPWTLWGPWPSGGGGDGRDRTSPAATLGPLLALLLPGGAGPAQGKIPLPHKRWSVALLPASCPIDSGFDCCATCGNPDPHRGSNLTLTCSPPLFSLGMWVPAGQAIGKSWSVGHGSVAGMGTGRPSRPHSCCVAGGYGPPPAGRGAPPPPPPFTSYIVSTPPGGFPPPQGFPQGYGAPPQFSKCTPKSGL